MKHFYSLKFIFCLILFAIISLSVGYSQSYFAFKDDNLVVNRGEYSIYFQNKIYELPLKLSDDLFLSFRYSTSEGIYAVNIISSKKIAITAHFTMNIMNSASKASTPINIDQIISTPVLADNIINEFGRNFGNITKYVPFVLNDKIYYAYIVSLPNSYDPLVYADSGSLILSIDGVEQKYTFTPEMIRALQDFGLIMSMFGLR